LRYGVPAPFQFEAPSSWLTRLACAQGLGTLEELLRFLELPVGVDLDWHLQGPALDELRRRCRLPRQSFGVSSRLMAGAGVCDVRLDKLLLTAKDGGARFRFCPCCLAERRVPYLDIHWRFACWRWCPVHNAVLYDACPACTFSVQHPLLIESTRAGRAGHATLNRCANCSNGFSGPMAQQYARDCIQALGKAEMLRLTNGRAVLAALYRQYFKLRGRWHIVQGLGAEYGPLVGHGIRRIDRKLAAWRATREFLADLSDADASEDLESAPSLDLQTVLTTILP
jgi:hypothetical protein